MLGGFAMEQAFTLLDFDRLRLKSGPMPHCAVSKTDSLAPWAGQAYNQ